MTVKIYSLDQDTVIQAIAAKDDGTTYDQSEISLIRILRRGPRNDLTAYPAITATFTAGATFEGTISGTLPIEGYWGFQFEYTLVSSSKPIYTKIFWEYVGHTIVPSA